MNQELTLFGLIPLMFLPRPLCNVSIHLKLQALSSFFPLLFPPAHHVTALAVFERGAKPATLSLSNEQHA